MKVSVCITVLNEEGTIGRLLESLLTQTKKPDEIVIVDGGSKDRTVEIIRHFQKKDKRIKLLVQKCSRGEGRNLGIEIAKNDVIAITDAGCIAHKDWLENITAPFIHEEIDIVAGFYKMVGESSYQKAIAVFLGVTPSKFNMSFLSSTRSMAMRKALWERIGGFPESNENSAEDTELNFKAVMAGARISRVKNAIVEWGMPETLSEGLQKLHDYAKWDARYGIWWHPTQKFSSHNIKVLTIFARYFLGLALLIYSLFFNRFFTLYLYTLISLYLFWGFRKVYLETKSVEAGLWGIIIQISSDFAIMSGFLRGKLRQ